MSLRNQQNGYTRLLPVGMVLPTLPSKLRGGTEGTVKRDGAVVIEGIDGVQLQLADEDAIPPGTRVHIKRSNGAEWAKPLEEYKQERMEANARKQQRTQARERAKDYRRAKAETFWEQYNLPFEHDVAVNLRLSQLQRGSTGTGRLDSTVEHLLVQEDFIESNLGREAGDFLCLSRGENPELRVRWEDSNGDEYRPAITCSQCQKRMSRWK